MIKVPASSALTTRFISGGMFSYDGINPSSKMQGAIVNELIKYLNTTFKSDLQLVNISNIPGNTITLNP